MTKKTLGTTDLEVKFYIGVEIIGYVGLPNLNLM